MKNKEPNRRSFLMKGLQSAFLLGVAGVSFGKDSGKKVKLLTREGQLVEVDASKLEELTGRNVSAKELKNWVNPETKKS